VEVQFVSGSRAVPFFKRPQAEKGQGLIEAVAHGPHGGGQAIGRAVPHRDKAVPQRGQHLRRRLPAKINY
jgi:hypothetical protein